MDTQSQRNIALIRTAVFVLLTGVVVAVESTLLDGRGATIWAPLAPLVLVYLLSVPRWGIAVAFVVSVGGLAANPDSGASLVIHVVAVGLVVAATAGATELIGRFTSDDRQLRTPADMLILLAIGAGGLPLVAAAIEGVIVASATLAPFEGVGRSILLDALGRGAATVTLVPVLLWLRDDRRLPWDEEIQRIALPASIVGVIVAGAVALLPSASDPVYLIAVPLTIVAVWGGRGWYGVTLAAGGTLLVAATVFADAVPESTLIASRVVLWTMGATAGLVAASAELRRDTSLALRRQERQAESMFHRAATPTFYIEPASLEVVRANSAMIELVGMSSETIASHIAGDFINPEPGHRLEDVVAQPGSHEVIIRGVMGPRTGNLVIAQIHDAETGRMLSVGQFVDLTQMRDRAATLEQSNDSLAGFAHRVSHDLKTPLTSMHGFAMLLQNRDALPVETQDDLVRRIERGAARVMEQLDEMLVSARSMAETPRPTDFQDLANWLCEVTTPAIEECDGELSVEFHTDSAVLASAALRQILLNLVANSFKYTHPDRSPVVHVTSRASAEGIIFRVQDNGLGIPVSQLEAVFTSGMRLTPDVAPGDGSGLTTSRRLAEAQGGKLLATPQDEGSCFVLSMPVVVPDLPSRASVRRTSTQDH